MKNIHILPTNKPSRLFYSDSSKKLMLSSTAVSFKTFERSPQNIYITNDEEIKEGDYIFETDNGYINIAGKNYIKNETDFKIIISTDEYLIKDGVQAIDDDFLEWFVKNPSCESVDLEVDLSKHNGQFQTKYGWKIIIPQKEPKQCKCGSNWVNTTNKDNPFCFHCGKPLTQEHKQETLEEFIKSQPYYGYCTTEYKEGIEVGAKWQAERMGLMEIELRHTKTLLASCEKALEDRDKQAERMYSEEEVRKMLFDLGDVLFNNCQNGIKEGEPEKYFDVIIEQFKKK